VPTARFGDETSNLCDPLTAFNPATFVSSYTVYPGITLDLLPRPRPRDHLKCYAATKSKPHHDGLSVRERFQGMGELNGVGLVKRPFSTRNPS